MKNEHIANNLSKGQLLEPPCYLYRFRKLDKIFKKKELENQEIYFASSETLNDPVENLTNLFWKGDKIAWKGLFKHYIIILEQWELFEIIMGNSSNIVLNKNQLFHGLDQLPTKTYKDKVLNIYSNFFSHPSVIELIHFLGNRKFKIRRPELQFYLTVTLGFISELIFTSNQKYNQNIKSVTRYSDSLKKTLSHSFLSAIKEKETQLEDEEFIDTMFDIGSSFLDYKQMMLNIMLQNYPTTQTNKGKIPSLMIIDNYFSILESLIFPHWCTACFTQGYNNTAVWGHYSEGHTGVCLKFKTQRLKNGAIGISLINDLYSNTNLEKIFPFKKILYNRKYPEINFFKSIGTLPLPVLKTSWFSDEEGNQSSNTDLIQNENLWRNDYWNTFGQKTSIKLKEWEYEHEYRLVMTSFSSDIKNNNNRVFKYKFSDLEGIIFGIKTPDESKLEIMKIIADKCKKESRADFQFYQSYYNSKTGLIGIKKMNILI